ncbi:MAG: trigger factor [Roseburia sp.]
MKKRLLAIFLCTALVAGVTACGSDKTGESVEDTEVTAEESNMPEYNAVDYVTLGDYSAIEVTLDDDYSVTEDDVKEFLESSVLAYYPYYVDLDKDVVEEGDFVNIDYVGYLNGEAFDGGSAEGYILEIGSDSFIDGFEDGLIDAVVGETLDLNLTFPETYGSADLAGQDVVFTVTVNKIVEKQDVAYEDIDDDYVAYVKEQNPNLDYDSAEDMISDVQTYLESTAESNKDSAIRSAVLDKITEICTVDSYPDGLLDYRLSEILAQYESYYCDEETTLEDYVENTLGESYEEFVAELQEEVELDVDTQLILEAIASVEGITFDEEEFQTYVNDMLSSYGYSSESTLYLSYGSTEQAGRSYLEKIFVCNQALEMICGNAVVTGENTEDSTETVDSTEQE